MQIKHIVNKKKKGKKNMTKTEVESKKKECFVAGWVKEVQKTDTEESLLKFFRNYKEPWLLVITANHKEILFDYSTFQCASDYFVRMYRGLDDDEYGKNFYLNLDGYSVGMEMGWLWNTNFCVRTLLRDYEYLEISNGVTSIYLDDFNLSCWRDIAEKVKEQYKETQVPGTKISGYEYYSKIYQMADIAEKIITGELVPDIFERIPIKKDGTFQKDRIIPIFSNGIGRTYSYDTGGNYYSEKARIQLCIICDNVGCDYDALEDIAPSCGRLLIRSRDNVPKRELLNADMTVNDLRRRK